MFKQKWSSEKLKISYHDDDDDLAFRVLFQFLLNFYTLIIFLGGYC